MLSCNQASDIIELDFPAMSVSECEPRKELMDALGGIDAAFAARSKFDEFLIVRSEEVIRALTPDFTALAKVTAMRGVIVSSESNDPRFDFVSRFFAPGFGVDEDPVTGSAHCCLGPYWAKRLGKAVMTAFQASRRGGVVSVRVMANRVVLGGRVTTVAQSKLLNFTA